MPLFIPSSLAGAGVVPIYGFWENFAPPPPTLVRQTMPLRDRVSAAAPPDPNPARLDVSAAAATRRWVVASWNRLPRYAVTTATPGPGFHTKRTLVLFDFITILLYL